MDNEELESMFDKEIILKLNCEDLTKLHEHLLEVSSPEINYEDLEVIYKFLNKKDKKLLNLFLKVLYKFGRDETASFINSNFSNKNLCF